MEIFLIWIGFGLTIFCCLFSSFECANHYCVQNDFSMWAKLHPQADQSEQVRGYLRDTPDALRTSVPLKCRWEFSVAGVKPDRPMQLTIKAEMLSDSPPGLACGQTGMRYSMAQPLCRGNRTSLFWCSASTAPHTIVTIPVFNSSNVLTVSYHRAATDNVTGIQALTVSVPKPGYCGRDWLAFKGRCYFVSSKGLTLNEADEVWKIYRGPRLAAFESVAEIGEFLQANENRARESPYRPPLDLSQPVRIGLARRLCREKDASARVVRLDYWRFNNTSGCFDRGQFNDSTPGHLGASSNKTDDFNCVTLQSMHSPDAGQKPQLEASDCKSTMLSLLAFEEVPLIGYSEACPAADCDLGRGDLARLIARACSQTVEEPGGRGTGTNHSGIIVGGRGTGTNHSGIIVGGRGTGTNHSGIIVGGRGTGTNHSGIIVVFGFILCILVAMPLIF